jgi:lysyl-tRNA synthetase class 2
VTYRVLDGVSLASADPLGPPSAWRPAVDAWLGEARSFGWFPAVLSASSEGARAYVEAGLRALPLGDEAIIDVEEFTLIGPTMEPIRRAVRRIERAGYTISVARHAELSADLLAEMKQRADDWRGEVPERGFSMALGRLGDPADGQCVAVLARDRDGRLRGLLSMVPWGQRGLSLDLMRRDRESENGVIEAMVAELVRAARDDLRIEQISLNFAMFRGIFGAAERVGARPTVRFASRMLTFASRFWQIESLYRSNARYLPRWETRYLCYDSALTLARISLAAGRAEGFLPALVDPPERGPDDEVEWGGVRMPLAAAVVLQRESAGRHRLPVRRLKEQQRLRMAKLDHLRAADMDPYPVAVPRDSTLADVVSGYPSLAAGECSGRTVSVVGRVHAVRDFGGVVFLVLQDGPDRLQVLIERRCVGEAAHALLRRDVDLGDHVSVTGEVVSSRHGELSIRAASWQLAAKCLQPLPNLREGLTDPEALVRRRHLSMIVNPEVTELLVTRSRAVRGVREAFARRDFLEVETPMLQAVHGGANARPFRTHINAYDTSLYLRIAPELYLKRLCVGGLPRIFELNRNFRNEGADATHNPEFTSVEAYQAHSDYLGMRDLTRELILEVATAVSGRPVARRPGPDGRLVEVDLCGPWRSVTVHDAVSAALDAHVDADTTMAELTAICAGTGIPLHGGTVGQAVVDLYERLVEQTTVQPTFYLDFPAETSPLTRRSRRDARLAERWDLVAFGMEIGTAYSELIDPVEQRQRLTEQSIAAADGDPEAMEVDEAFLEALEFAMPPTGGLGLGVDRLVMMLTGASIRQTLAFPFVRPGAR